MGWRHGSRRCRGAPASSGVPRSRAPAGAPAPRPVVKLGRSPPAGVAVDRSTSRQSGRRRVSRWFAEYFVLPCCSRCAARWRRSPGFTRPDGLRVFPSILTRPCLTTAMAIVRLLKSLTAQSHLSTPHFIPARSPSSQVICCFALIDRRPHWVTSPPLASLNSPRFDLDHLVRRRLWPPGPRPRRPQSQSPRRPRQGGAAVDGAVDHDRDRVRGV